MKQVFRFKISVKASSKSVVRQIVSVPYDDHVVCTIDLRMTLNYLAQAQIRVMGYYVDTEYVDVEQLNKEVYAF